MNAPSELLGPSRAVSAPHALHAHDRDFRETNCYVDMVIELVHALGLEPTACLGFPIASDFEGDQWTFIKPATSDLDRLYGIGIEELCLWRPLVLHVEEQLRRGRIPLVEVDSHFLPDTQGSDYRARHAKTSIAITHMDTVGKTLRYFHNAGCFELSGPDFDGTLGVGDHAPLLPPYTEIVKLDRCVQLDPQTLRARSRELARGYLDRRPRANPITAYAARMAEHLAWIRTGGFDAYHAYSFASVRQLGSAFELLASYARYLDAGANGSCARAAEQAATISTTAKAMILRLARVANSGRTFDASETMATMARAWNECMQHLEDALA